MGGWAELGVIRSSGESVGWRLSRTIRRRRRERRTFRKLVVEVGRQAVGTSAFTAGTSKGYTFVKLRPFGGNARQKPKPMPPKPTKMSLWAVAKVLAVPTAVCASKRLSLIM